MASCVIIDGAAIVQMLHPKNSRSFSEYASDVLFLTSCHNFAMQHVWTLYGIGMLKTPSKAQQEQNVGKEFAGELWQKEFFPKISSPSFE